jgi:hypothetical protein
VYPIGREDYTREVTEASNVDEEPSSTSSTDADADDAEEQKGQGTGVVCFLYRDGQPRSERTFAQMRTLAARHPRTKFVSIVGDKCIPNLPDSRVPMIIVYRKGEIRNQVVAWGADRERSLDGERKPFLFYFGKEVIIMRAELEILLLVTGAIIPPERPPEKKRNDSDEDSDDEEDGPPRRSAATSTNGRANKNIRGPAKKKAGDDSDSDFDFDL